MSVPVRLLGFALAIAALFVGAAIAGRASGVEPRSSGGGGEHAAEAMAPAAPVGLSLSDGELVLEPLTRTLPAGERTELRFRIRDGATVVRSFDVEHERRMHVIVVRRDLTGFQHVHPVMAADGTWSVPLRVAEPGTYRLFLQFVDGGSVHTAPFTVQVRP